MNSRRLALLPSLLAALAVGCAGTPLESSEDALDLGSNGALKAYWADASKLELHDLQRATAGFATEKLNDALAGSHIGARLQVPSVYGATAEPNRVLPEDVRIKGLGSLVTELDRRFGATEFGVEVNRARFDAISRGDAKYFVEAAFRLNAGLDHGWNFDAHLPANATAALGFAAGAELESRAVVATDDSGLGATVLAPLQAAKGLRGFVLPRSIGDVRKMKPGEMFALRGVGRLAANLGLGVPVLTAGPAGLYRVVASAGMSTLVEGTLDVQLVRLAGDEVVVDVGVENIKQLTVKAGVRDEFGIKGLCDDGERCLRAVKLAGQSVDLAEVAEKAVENRLNAKFQSHLEISKTTGSSRVGLSRVRFSLDRGNADEVASALERALKFDLRLAQALANRDLGEAGAPIRNEFDALRTATTSSLDFGFGLLGIDVYQRTVVEKAGTFVLQTPSGITTLTYDKLEKKRSFLGREHGFSRTGLSARSLDARTPNTWRSEANLLVSTNVGDQNVHDDRVIDALDAVLGSVGGWKAVAALDGAGSRLERQVFERCPLQPSLEFVGTYLPFDDTCNVALLNDPATGTLHGDGLLALYASTTGLPEESRKLVHAAGDTRLALQSIGLTTSPQGAALSVSVDVRFDDAALAVLVSRPRADYEGALRELLASAAVERSLLGTELTREASLAAVDEASVRKMGELFAARADAYASVLAAEADLRGALAGKRFVASPLGIRFAVDGAGAPLLRTAALSSTAHERSLAAVDLFDGLRQAANRKGGLYGEHLALFPLVALVPASQMDLSLHFELGEESEWKAKSGGRERFRAAKLATYAVRAVGDKVAPISLGTFDVDAVVNNP